MTSKSVKNTIDHLTLSVETTDERKIDIVENALLLVIACFLGLVANWVGTGVAPAQALPGMAVGPAVAAEMLLQHQQAAAGQWDSSANPLLSHTESERYLRELQEEMQRHGPPGPGHASRPGSSRTSLEGGREAHAAGEQAPAPEAAAGGGARKLAAPLPLHQLYAEGSKYPGAGTWVRCVPACA